MLKKAGYILGSFLLMIHASYASLIVPITLVSGMKIGTVQLDDTIYGLLLTPKLHHLSAGMHGFAVTTYPSCSHDAQAAGGHWDPEETYLHRGPYRGSGHDGDLPVLMVNSNGRATLPLLAPRLKLSQVMGRSLVIVAGGDDYSDKSLKRPGSVIRIACGVVPYH